MSVNLIKLAINFFQYSVYIFKNERRTDHDIDIAK